MQYSEEVTQRERLRLLQLLNQDGDKAATEYELKQAMAAMGRSIAGDKLKDQLRWLEQQWLVKIQPSLIESTGMVVRITERGVDVATGATVMDGVEQPRREAL